MFADVVRRSGDVTRAALGIDGKLSIAFPVSVREPGVGTHPSAGQRFAAGARTLPEDTVEVPPPRAPLAPRSVSGNAVGEAFGRRHAQPHRDPSLRAVPPGHRRGPTVLADRGPRGAGDRGPKLRPGDHGMERLPGRDAEDTDLCHYLVPGLWRHPR